MKLQHLYKKDWLILTLVFVTLFVSTSLFSLVDETPLESTLPWPLQIISLVGLGLEMVINLPLIWIVHLINAHGIIIPYELYFSILPCIAAAVYTFLVAKILSVRNKRKLA